jgi:16S rRNA (cytosine967-C5)-methyltransferase
MCKGVDKFMDARTIATQILTQVLKERHSLSDCLETHLPSLNDARDRALAQALCYGVLRWLPRLEALLEHLLRKPLEEKDCDIKALLLIGFYQQMHLRIPPHAAIAATVEVTRTLKKPWATKLVNAILRRFQRQQEPLLTDIDKNISTKLAHPPWLLKRLQRDWATQWEAIVQANNTHPPLTLRVNARHKSRENYLKYLDEANVAAEPTHHTAYGITLEKNPSFEVREKGITSSEGREKGITSREKGGISHLPGFTQGWVSVQDGAAQLAAQLLDVPAGARVLDACAAPGGKTAHLLEHYTIDKLLALDNQPARLQRLAETLRRLQLSAEWRCANAAKPDTWWDGQFFDRILLDVPCSGSGVIRRHPDIKYLRLPRDITTLAAQQKRLLERLWPLLKQGGKLLYVTCSVFSEENHLQIQNFLATQTDAYETEIVADWGHAQPVGRQILPGENNLDGFYYACLSKHREALAKP